MAKTIEKSAALLHLFEIAEEEARRRNHGEVDTGHVLLALLSLEETAAYCILVYWCIYLEGAERAVKLLMRDYGAKSVEGKIPFSFRMERVLTLAQTEASHRKLSCLTTEHLLGALLMEGESTAAGILQTLGVTPQKLEQVRGMFADYEK